MSRGGEASDWASLQQSQGSGVHHGSPKVIEVIVETSLHGLLYPYELVNS